MIGMVLLFSVASMAQKFALVDMEYILKNIPAYEMTKRRRTCIRSIRATSSSYRPR